MQVISGKELSKALKEKTYQGPFPETVQCKCRKTAYPLLLVDDEDGQLSNNSPVRKYNGKPIWPHDCCAFALYMCEDCGEIVTNWNQG